MPGHYDWVIMKSVEIRVKGILDPSWSEWIGNLEISYQQDSSLFSGEIKDQAMLYGIIKKIRDMGLELMSIEIVDS